MLLTKSNNDSASYEITILVASTNYDHFHTVRVDDNCSSTMISSFKHLHRFLWYYELDFTRWKDNSI